MFPFIVFLQGLTIAILFIEFIWIFDRWSSRKHSNLIMLVLATLINNTGYLIEILSTGKEGALAGLKICYLGKTFVPLMIMIMALYYAGIILPKIVIGILAFFQSAIWVLVLTSSHHSLYYSSIFYSKEGLFAHLVLNRGPLYYVFIASSCIYIIIGFIMTLRQYKREKRGNEKKQIFYFLVMMCVAVIGLLLFLLNITGGYDTTAVAYCLCAVLLMVSVFRFDLLGTVEQAKDYAMDHLSDAMFVFDSSRELIYSNERGKEILEKLAIKENRVLDLFREQKLFCQDEVYTIRCQNLEQNNRKQGVLYLLHDITDSFRYEEHLERAVALQTKKAEDRRKKLERISLQTVETLADAIDAKDKYTKGHSYRVAEYSVILARELGYSEEQLDNLRYAALLHDVGKIGVPDSVLNKPSKLTDIEYEIIKSHPVVGSDILKNIDSIPGVNQAARFHHERYDGRGYPDGLRGEEIPEIARIVGIADAYDAMTSKRVYRKSLPAEVVREELVNGEATQFDPNFLTVFLKLLDEGKLVLEEKEKISQESVDTTGELLQKVMQSMSLKEKEERDFLTGLMLRKDGERQIIEAMSEVPGCLAFVDVDNLKKVNDTMGHLLGDHLLQEVGSILKEYEKQCVVCRLGGDEFLMFMKDLSEEEAECMMKEIFSKFQEKKENDITMHSSSLSAGICASSPEDSFQDVYNKADKALYFIKQNGKASYYFYHKEDEQIAETANVDLQRLVESLQNSGNYTGALEVEYRVFSKLYEYTKNLGSRYDEKFDLAMVTLDNKEELNIDEMEHAMQCMEQAIRTTIRNVDICTRYSGVQFLIIFVNVGKENVKKVRNRIIENYLKLYPGTGIDVKFSMAELPKEQKTEGEGEA